LRIDIVKRSLGRSRIDASAKADALVYSYRISNDTIYLDDYFTVPAGNKWSADNVSVTLSIPEGTRVYFDRATENMYRRPLHETEVWMEGSEAVTNYGSSTPSGHFWIMSKEGLEMQHSEERK
jgi:hypothetical protein